MSVRFQRTIRFAVQTSWVDVATTGAVRFAAARAARLELSVAFPAAFYLELTRTGSFDFDLSALGGAVETGLHFAFGSHLDVDVAAGFHTCVSRRHIEQHGSRHGAKCSKQSRLHDMSPAKKVVEALPPRPILRLSLALSSLHSAT
jgi:hypothetical protein